MRPTATFELRTNSPQLAEGLAPVKGSLNRADTAPIALLVCSLIAVFWKVVFTPAMFFYRDVFRFTYPHARFIHEACRQATLPYWNPYLNYGEPLLANPNFLFFYPSTLFLVLLPIDLAYTLHYVAHFAVAAVGTYWLARRLDQSRAAAFFAAFVFAFSGPALSLGNLYNHVACAAWIPWALVLTDRAVEGSSWRPWLLLSLVFSLQLLAAEPFTLFATVALSFALALYRSRAIRHPLAGASRRIVGHFLLVGCLMVALSAVQLFPSLDLLANSLRGRGLTFNQTVRWSFHPLSLLDVVIPNFFGPSFAQPGIWAWVLNWGHDPYFTSVFVGFVPVFFALIGWAWGKDRRRGFFTAAALAFLLLSFGQLTPLFALAYLLFPLLQFVRFPVKLLVPVMLLIALLAGWGLDTLRRFDGRPSRKRGRVLLPLQGLLAGSLLLSGVSWVAPEWIVVPVSRLLVQMNRMVTRNPAAELSLVQAAGAAKFFLTMLRLYLPGLAGFALGGYAWIIAFERGRRWARGAVPVVAALGLAQLVMVNSEANPTVPKSFYTYRPPILSHFQDSARPYRFYDLSQDWTPPQAPLGAQDFVNFDSIPEAADFSPLALGALRAKLLLESGSMLERVEVADSGDVDGSVAPFVFEFWGYAASLASDPTSTDYLLGRSNVRYLLLRNHQPGPARREVTVINNGSPQPNVLYEDLSLVPRAYVAQRASWSTDSSEILTRLASPGFDDRHEVILFGKPEAAASDLVRAAGTRAPPSSSREGSSGTSEVTLVEWRPNTVRLQVSLPRPGYVVLLDRFNPNWHAILDGREVPLLRANQMFRAVLAPAGEHEIRFAYRQRGLVAGLILSLSSLALLAAMYAIEPRRRGARYAASHLGPNNK